MTNKQARAILINAAENVLGSRCEDEPLDLYYALELAIDALDEAIKLEGEMMKDKTEKGYRAMKVGDRVRVVALNQKYLEHVLLPYEGSEIGRLGTVVAAGNGRAFPTTAHDVCLDGDDESGWWSECYLEAVENDER